MFDNIFNFNLNDLKNSTEDQDSQVNVKLQFDYFLTLLYVI